MDTMDRKQAIGLMLASFPASQSQGQLVALAYLVAVEDSSDYAINYAAREFIKGTVPDHDRRFAPSTAQFAARVALHDKNASPAVVEMLARKPELLEQADYPPEYRAEMKRRVAGLLSFPRISSGDREGHEDAA